MKLILCKNCSDVIRLFEEVRHCKCGRTGGKYLNDVESEYWGEDAMPIGFANPSLLQALRGQPEKGKGREFKAFIIPKDCPTMKKVKNAAKSVGSSHKRSA